MIRMFEDRDQKGRTAPGTEVMPVNRDISFYADSADEAEQRLRKEIAAGKYPAGRVYQICPWMANAEMIRSVASGLDGSFQRIFLDPVGGMYSATRRIRLPRPTTADANEGIRSAAEVAKSLESLGLAVGPSRAPEFFKQPEPEPEVEVESVETEAQTI